MAKIQNVPKERSLTVGAFELPLPNWCIPALGLIAVLSVGYSLLGQPVQTVYSRYLLGRTEEQDQLESYKHFAELPAAEVHDSGADGTLEARLFSDGCVSVAWKSAASNAAPHPHFIKKVKTEDVGVAPGPQPNAEAVGSQTARALLAGVGSLAPGAPARPAAGAGCMNPHPGAYTTSYGSRNGCWVEVWRRFADGCVHYQWFNSCANVWDVAANGDPRVYWTQCQH